MLLPKHVSYSVLTQNLTKNISKASPDSQSMFLIQVLFEIDWIAPPRLRDTGSGRIGANSHSFHIVFT